MEKILAHVLTWSEATLAVLAAIGTLWVAMKKLYKIAKNIESLVDSTSKNTAAIDRIEKQVFANGGTSLMDAINRIDRRVAVLEHVVPSTLTVNVAAGEQ